MAVLLSVQIMKFRNYSRQQRCRCCLHQGGAAVWRIGVGWKDQAARARGHQGGHGHQPQQVKVVTEGRCLHALLSRDSVWLSCNGLSQPSDLGAGHAQPAPSLTVMHSRHLTVSFFSIRNDKPRTWEPEIKGQTQEEVQGINVAGGRWTSWCLSQTEK